MRCKRCNGFMFIDVITTTDGTIKTHRCFICGHISDTLVEINKINPPPPPEKRGRKPNLLVREVKRKPLIKKKVML
ncbi:MAG: hypothetical protein NZ927_08640 [Candidatus Calescibacterium sp.]|nr:hypothetical protein [Candidatus Calescibacterium sp.]MCX7733435.1 hypothetical protein [bacterium]MDW8087538.1 hypothetical protein [Candidatus Calescibacterium sp.]